MSTIPDAAMQAALEAANVERDADGLWFENATIFMQAAFAAALPIMLREVANRYEASQNIEGFVSVGGVALSPESFANLTRILFGMARNYDKKPACRIQSNQPIK